MFMSMDQKISEFRERTSKIFDKYALFQKLENIDSSPESSTCPSQGMLADVTDN